MALVNLSETTRNIVYGGGLIGTGAAVIAQAVGVINAESANSVVQLITIVGGLLGVSAATTATSVLASQRKNGAVIGDVELPSIEVPTQLSTIDKITQAVEEVTALDNQVKSGLDQLTAITGGLINVPGVLAQMPNLPGPLDDLVRGAGARYSTTR